MNEHLNNLLIYFGLFMAIFSTFMIADEKKHKFLKVISLIALFVFAISAIVEAILFLGQLYL